MSYYKLLFINWIYSVISYLLIPRTRTASYSST